MSKRAIVISCQRLQTHAQLRGNRLDARVSQRIEANGPPRPRKLRHQRHQRAVNAGTDQDLVFIAIVKATLQPLRTSGTIVSSATEILIPQQSIRVRSRKQPRRGIAQTCSEFRRLGRHVHGHLDTAATGQRQRSGPAAYERAAAGTRVEQPSFARFGVVAQPT